jgi:hypothetical protein
MIGFRGVATPSSNEMLTGAGLLDDWSNESWCNGGDRRLQRDGVSTNERMAMASQGRVRVQQRASRRGSGSDLVVASHLVYLPVPQRPPGERGLEQRSGQHNQAAAQR